jgi:hypothetical protein
VAQYDSVYIDVILSHPQTLLREMEEFRKAPRRLLGALVDHSISRKIKRKTAARNKGDEEWLRHWNTRIPHSCPKIMSREWLLADGIAVDSQPNSKFFHMLPLELRQAIYELALGGATIELEFCDDPKDEHFVVCRKGPRWLFGLPKSCRLT